MSNKVTTGAPTLDFSRFPAEKAKLVAGEIVDSLGDVCERIEIAGSLRRCKPFVKDIEIVYVPKFERRRADLFKDTLENLADKRIATLIDLGLLERRQNVNGHEAWGAKNKLARHVASGIGVDLFSTTEDNFFNYLVCRTGGAKNNIRICRAAISKGWKWMPYGEGFIQSVEQAIQVGNPIREGNRRIRPCNSEREVFEFVDLTYLEPWER
jgi:DNA polymerase/3'-5' exonuclease PolX